MDKNTSEIAKLTERISRDPKSKLFVPLAEEYKKAGDIEMAVHVLTEGLKNNPGYVTARSFLGRLLYEMGDMAAAQREFEEVVKAVPDNLLAQKKLGDLHVLLGNRTEALKYYKTARSLNPADAEIASLVSDLEAGIDVRPGIVKPKTARAPEPAVTAGTRSVPQQQTAESAKTEEPVEPAGTASSDSQTGPQNEEAPAPLTPAVYTEEAAAATIEVFPSAGVPEGPDVSREEESSTAAGEVFPSEIVPEEPELAEEVLVVEPLEEEFPLEGAPSSVPEDQGFPGESEPEPAPAAAGEAAPHDEIPAVPPEPDVAARTGDESDDFTTDTLAELYVGQGFYEKAIDIYERMLADHPDSGAIKDKLDRVRSLAASSESEFHAPQIAGETPAAEPEAAIAAEAPEPLPTAAPSAEGKEVTLEADLVAEPEGARQDAAPSGGLEDIFAEPNEYQPPRTEEEKTAGTDEEKFVDAVMNPPAEEFAEAKTAPFVFEPREYIPPDAATRTGTEEKERTGPKQSREHRKEVIGRLENWLKTIKKES